MAESRKKLTYMTGSFVSMTEPEIIQLAGKDPKKRSVITVATDDGQKGFFEVRDAIISKATKMGILEGDTIEIGFVMIGSEKGERRFNNLFINSIDYAYSGGREV